MSDFLFAIGGQLVGWSGDQVIGGHAVRWSGIRLSVIGNQNLFKKNFQKIFALRLFFFPITFFANHRLSYLKMIRQPDNPNTRLLLLPNTPFTKKPATRPPDHLTTISSGIHK